jgi:hypothetical protein
MFRSKVLHPLSELESKPNMKLAMRNRKQGFRFFTMLTLLKKSGDLFDLVISGGKYFD